MGGGRLERQIGAEVAEEEGSLGKQKEGQAHRGQEETENAGGGGWGQDCRKVSQHDKGESTCGKGQRREGASYYREGS